MAYCDDYMATIGKVGAAEFEELTGSGPVFDSEHDVRAELMAIGYECHQEAASGSSWPSCGCPMLGSCCPVIRAAECGGRYAVYPDFDGCIPLDAMAIETACDTREPGAYRPYDPHPGGLSAAEVAFWLDPEARRLAEQRRHGFEAALGELVSKGLVDVVDVDADGRRP